MIFTLKSWWEDKPAVTTQETRSTQKTNQVISERFEQILQEVGKKILPPPNTPFFPHFFPPIIIESC